MKGKHYILSGLLLLGGFLFAQEDSTNIGTDSEVRFNQYGVAVNRLKLNIEARDGILVFESDNQDYKLWFDNRVQLDGAYFFGDDYNDIGNGTAIRRARFAIKTQLYKKWYGEVDVDFANGKFELKDAFIKYTVNDNLEVKGGNFKEGFSMEATTSSRYTTLMERAMVVSAFAPSRHIGLQAIYNKDWILGIAGIHFQSIEDSETAVNVETNNKDYGRNTGNSYTAKAVFMPLYKHSDKSLHFGLGFSYREPKSDVAETKYGSVRYSSRALSSINRKKYVDTGDIMDVDHDILTGIELAGHYKAYKIQSEYIANSTVRKKDLKTVNFNGFYVQGSAMLFGGQQVYNHSEGEFTQPTRGKKWGDLELAFRYDFIDLNNKDIKGGSSEGYTLGLNYYVNKNVKFAFNYTFINNDRYANGKGKLNVGYNPEGNLTTDPTQVVASNKKAGDDFNFAAIRMEIDF